MHDLRYGNYNVHVHDDNRGITRRSRIALLIICNLLSRWDYCSYRESA